MTSRLHEGMTRTQPPRSGPPLRVAALIALCAATLLILGWAVFSPLGGTGEHQAQAQTPAPDRELGAGANAGEEEPSYEAFGEPRSDLFTPIVPLANEDGSGDGADNGDGAANGDGSGSPQGTGGEDLDGGSSSNGTSTGNDNDSLNSNGNSGNSQQNTTSSAPQPNGGAAAGSDAGNVNCQNPEDDFEELLCEEGAGGSTDDRTGSAPPGGMDDDRDGGSGRSGAGEPTDTFRNGGPAPGK